MNAKLKKDIINWLFENENVFQRTNVCVSTFKDYIYNSEGNYLHGGKEVTEFIREVEKLLF